MTVNSNEHTQVIGLYRERVCVCVCVCTRACVFVCERERKKGWLVGWVLWHINLCRLFNAKSIFMQIVLFQTIQLSMNTQFNCQKHFYFKQFSLFKQF